MAIKNFGFMISTLLVTSTSLFTMESTKKILESNDPLIKQLKINDGSIDVANPYFYESKQVEYKHIGCIDLDIVRAAIGENREAIEAILEKVPLPSINAQETYPISYAIQIPICLSLLSTYKKSNIATDWLTKRIYSNIKPWTLSTKRIDNCTFLLGDYTEQSDEISCVTILNDKPSLEVVLAASDLMDQIHRIDHEDDNQ